jgi:4-amino-4-deoxy-L-arabinose transferase-like glycosyltransferase
VATSGEPTAAPERTVSRRGVTVSSLAAPLPRFDRRVLVVALAVFAVLMALSPWYGFDRDELYFFDAARHLQGGYVDQPILVPLLARVTLALFGVSLPGLRLWPALAALATVIVGALIARELGGGRRAQLVAALGTATMPVLLGADHLAGPTAIDLLAWAALALVAVRVGRTGDPRWWLAGGAVLGVGLTNKHSVGFLGVALLAGFLLSGGWRLVLNRWFLAGALVAAAFAVPDLWWQAQNGWPTVAMTRELNRENGGAVNAANWVVGQLLMVSLALVWICVAGLLFLWRSRRPERRALVWAYALLYVLFAATTGGKIYYLAGAYVYLLAAGVVAVDAWLAAGAWRLRTLLVALAVTTVALLPLTLPVLPGSDIGWTAKVNGVPTESLGWPQLVASVRRVWRSLPPSTRANAVIFTANYGEAGAINELGRGSGLPRAVSGHNNEWWWGPGNPDATTVVAVAPGPVDTTGYGRYLRTFCDRVRVAATLRNPDRIHNQEWGGHVFVCTGLREPWKKLWPSLRHYD